MHIIRVMASAFALAWAVPAIAQTDEDAVAVVEAIWPDGTMATMMQQTMEPMMDQIMVSTANMPMDAIIDSIAQMADDQAEAEEIRQVLSGMTMGEMMAVVDPHYLERQRIMMGIMVEEMTPMMVELEPDMKRKLASVMAREYSASELAAARSFFETEHGRAFGAKFMNVYTDPEYMSVMNDMMPRIVEIIPRVMERSIEATAHLPEAREGAEERLKALLEEKGVAQ